MRAVLCCTVLLWCFGFHHWRFQTRLGAFTILRYHGHPGHIRPGPLLAFGSRKLLELRRCLTTILTLEKSLDGKRFSIETSCCGYLLLPCPGWRYTFESIYTELEYSLVRPLAPQRMPWSLTIFIRLLFIDF
jgi:hypothetical protein